MNTLLGEERAERLRSGIKGMNSINREKAIMAELLEALKEHGGKYSLYFCFKGSNGKRTSHHLIFVCKHERGIRIMKEIMAGYSSNFIQGVPDYTFSKQRQTELPFNSPLDELEDMLLKDFAGRTIKMEDIFNRHHADKPFTQANYKEALCQLESRGQITIDPPADKRRLKVGGGVTLSDSAVIMFTKKE